SILAIIDYRNLSKNFDGWMAGTLIYLKWTGIGITVVASAVGIILLAFKNWGVLANSWLGRQIALLKKNLCVRFIECPGQANKA
ncbi:MAG: hypothetical protein Q8R55_07075, partial [Candidatus Taylorbacteria bacterium]|nr:hypothetical protein [Candidatus Taylorbacteria bacterium]